MAYTLKNLKITSTDLVDQGANPEAHVRLFKSVVAQGASPLELAQQEEIAQLKKQLAMEKMVSFAKKFEDLGKQPEDLAGTLYHLKETSPVAYGDYVSILEEQLILTRQSTLFVELGHNTQQSGPSVEQLDQLATRRAEKDYISTADAVVKIFEENPDFAKEYEKSYWGKRHS